MSLIDENRYKQFVGWKRPPFDCKHPNYHTKFLSVFCENVLIFHPRYPSLLHALSLTHFLSLSLRFLALSHSVSSHIKTLRILYLIINCFKKVVLHTSRCFTCDRLITIIEYFRYKACHINTVQVMICQFPALANDEIVWLYNNKKSIHFNIIESTIKLKMGQNFMYNKGLVDTIRSGFWIPVWLFWVSLFCK